MKPQSDIDFGTLINGSWTGVRGLLQRKVKFMFISNNLFSASSYQRHYIHLLIHI